MKSPNSHLSNSTFFLMTGVTFLLMMGLTPTSMAENGLKLDTNNMGTFQKDINSYQGSGPIGYSSLLSTNDMTTFRVGLANTSDVPSMYSNNLSTNNMGTFLKMLNQRHRQ